MGVRLERIARIERRLRPLEGIPVSNVIYKSIEPVTVYATHGSAPGMGPENVGPAVGPVMERLNTALHAAERPLIEPGIFWYDAQPDDTLGVHVSFVAETEPVAAPGYDVVELPAVPTAATLLHHGDMSGIGESWAALIEQVVADGYRIVGPSREVYLNADGHEPGPDWLTELQVPVER